MRTDKHTILFDNDGVLVDTESLFYEANCVMLREYGVFLDEKTFAEMSMTRGMSLADIIVSLGKTPEEAEAARQKRNGIYNIMLQERSGSLVIPGVPEALEKLHRHFRVGIVTCCQTIHFNTIHESSGLRPYFDFVVGDDDFVLHKPHPEPYLTALRHAGIGDPAGAIAVEDSERGIMSAQAAGIEAAAIPRGPSLFGDFSKADHRFETIGEFAAMMLGDRT